MSFIACRSNKKIVKDSTHVLGHPCAGSMSATHRGVQILKQNVLRLEVAMADLHVSQQLQCLCNKETNISIEACIYTVTEDAP